MNDCFARSACVWCSFALWLQRLKPATVLDLLAHCRRYVAIVTGRRATAAIETAGAKTTASVTIAAPGIVLSAGASLHYVPSLVSWLTNSVTIDAGNMATNLNQIDAALKALTAEVAALKATIGTDDSALAAKVADGFAAINKRLDDLIGGPSDDQTQARVDDLTAKLKASEEKLKSVLSPDQ